MFNFTNYFVNYYDYILPSLLVVVFILLVYVYG